MRHLVRFSRNFWRKLPCRFLLAVGLSALLGVVAARTFLGSVALVSGMSMVPTYQPGTWVYTAPLSTPPERGDIVLLDDGNKDFALKRIIGLPGETVYLRHGYVYINGLVLLEPYLAKYTYTFPSERAAVFVLGDEQYFVLGDNRPASADSRIYGPVDRDQIKRRIPLPAGTLRAHLGQYTLPNYTDLVSRHPVQKLDTAESSF